MVEFDYEGRHYKLGFNRKTAAAIERAGYSNEAIDKMPNVVIPLLVQGAFQLNHKHLRSDEIDEIFGGLKDRDGFVAALIKEYNKTFETLMSESGEIEWTAT